MSTLIYNGEYVVTLSNIGVPVDTGSTSLGAFTGNGKQAMYVSLSNVGTTRCMTSGNAQFNNIGKYINNTVDTFHTNDITIKHPSYNETSLAPEWVHQTLDMASGSVETLFSVNSNNQAIASITSTITPLRQYPYCILQAVTFSTTASYGQNNVDIYHTIRSPSTGLISLEYNNNTIFNESISADNGIYILQGSGFNQTHKCNVTSAAAYIFPTSIENMVKPIGFNILNDKSAAYQKLRFMGVTPETSYTFYILSASMTSYDFTDTIEEVKRIIMNVMFKESTASALMTRIYADNLTMWNSMWEADVQISAKNNLTTNQVSSVQNVRKFTRQSLFNIFACLREAVNTEINPLNLSFIDTDGNIFFDGDLWLMPLLIMMKPNIARVLLENKFKLLEQAMQLSASFGYTGTKFPYKNDVLGYKNVYWDVVSPLHIFNNASIAVNIWNYFRVTQDLSWLQTKGYSMLRSIVEFFVSYAKLIDGEYNVNNTLGLGQIVCDNHAFTVNMILLALVYMNQVTNRLNYTADIVWTDMLDKLRLPIYNSGINSGVIRYFAAYDGTTQVDIVDNLVILLPLYNQLYFNNFSGRNTSDINKNLLYYLPRIKSGFATHPLNNMFIMGAYGMLSQTNTTYVANLQTYISNIINTNAVGVWGFMNSKNDAALGNDSTLNALFIMLIMTCICGVRIKGSTNPSNVQVESYGLEVGSQAQGVNMPSTWRNIRLLLATGFAEVANVYIA